MRGAPRLAALAAGLLLAFACAAAPAAQQDAEAARIIEVLGLAPGEVVADVGAGDGEWAVALARQVGPDGRVLATEITRELIAEIEAAAAEADLENLEAVLGDQESTGLPRACCDAALVRKTYHHFVHPAAMSAGLLAALEPGGRLLVVEYSSHLSERVEGVPENRSGHGLDRELLEAELAAAGFEVVSRHEQWMGKDDEYAVLFRKPGKDGGRPP